LWRFDAVLLIFASSYGRTLIPAAWFRCSYRASAPQHAMS